MTDRTSVALLVVASTLLASSLFLGIAERGPEEALGVTTTHTVPVSIEGSPTNPDAVRVFLPGASGGKLMDVTVARTGLNPLVRIVLEGPERTTYEIAGTLLLVGDPAKDFKLVVRAGATEAFAANVVRRHDTPTIDAWSNESSPANRFHLEAPLRYRATASGIVDLVVIDPATGDAQARIARDGAGFRLEAAGQHHTLPASALAIEGDAVAGAPVTFRFRDATGSEVGALTVDRATSPARVVLQGPVPLVVEGPFTLYGRLTSPDRIALHSDGQTFFAYDVGPDGSATLKAGSETLLRGARFVRLEGSPLDERFTLVLHDADGQPVRVPIERSRLIAESALPAEQRSTVVALSRELSALPGARPSYLVRAHDGRPNVLGAPELNGANWMQRDGTHSAILQIPDDAPVFDRVFLRYSIGSATGEAAFARFPVPGGADGLRADFAPASLAAADGATVNLEVIYEARITPLVAEWWTEPNVYRYRLDGTPPTVAFAPPARFDDFRLPLSWSGSDALTGVSGFDVHHRKSGDIQWRSWLDATREVSAVFSGDWDSTYEFRVRSLDGVGNPSPWVTGTTILRPQPADSDDVNDAPTIRLLSPRPGETIADIVTIRWEAFDPDGTPVFVTIQVSADDGLTWRTIYTGTGTSVAWNTATELDGTAYRIRAIASDGTLTASDATGGLVIRNAGGANAAPDGRGGATGADDSDGAGGVLGGGSRGIALVAVGVLVVATLAALVAYGMRRRSR